MNFSLYIARRYIFSKKSHNAINIISLISVIGIAIATMAMVCTLSIFNGFTDFAMKSFSGIDPDLKIIPTTGKVFNPKTDTFDKVRQLPEIGLIAETLEDNALVKFEDRQTPALIKGVSTEYKDVIKSDDIIKSGEFLVKDGDVNFGVIGGGLAMNLGANTNLRSPLEIFAPKRNVKINLANPSTAFERQNVYNAGVFVLNQEKYDTQLLFVSLDVAQQLFRYNNEVSALEIKVKNQDKIKSLKKDIQAIIGDQFLVQDRFQQQEESYRMVNIEKWVTFLILIFILVIAVFNIIGSLSMLILDKERDIKIFQSLGASNKLIMRIFALEGWLISFCGSIVGLILGLILCLLQQHFGLLKLGTTDGAFLIDAYPVLVEFTDILIIFCTVSFIGFLAVLYPINSLKKTLQKSKKTN